MAGPTWLTAFLDLPASEYDAAVAFWQGVTGYSLSASRGVHDEFATLLPSAGDAFLRVQRTQDGGPGVHLDVHAPGQDFEVCRSPGGLPYCLVGGAEARSPVPATWPGGHRSMVDQVCVDVPPAAWDEECAFWAGLTGWELVQGSRPEFRRLRVPSGQPLQVLLQRLDEDDGPVRAHLDLSADDRGAEVRRHEALGATVVAVHEAWTVMQPPAGAVYCVTSRVPAGRT
jgi:hypothetical protein